MFFPSVTSWILKLKCQQVVTHFPTKTPMSGAAATDHSLASLRCRVSRPPTPSKGNDPTRKPGHNPCQGRRCLPSQQWPLEQYTRQLQGGRWQCRRTGLSVEATVPPSHRPPNPSVGLTPEVPATLPGASPSPKINQPSQHLF